MSTSCIQRDRGLHHDRRAEAHGGAAPRPWATDPPRCSLRQGQADPAAGVDDFLSAMMEHAAGDFLAPRRVHQSYVNMAMAKGWPPITEIVLTKELVARGCRKRTLDLRSGKSNQELRMRRYGGKMRPVVIEFPEEELVE